MRLTDRPELGLPIDDAGKLIEFNMTPLGMAERMAHLMRGRVKYCVQSKQYLLLVDGRWVLEQNSPWKISGFATDVTLSMLLELDRPDCPYPHAEYHKFALKCQSFGRLRELAKLLRFECEIVPQCYKSPSERTPVKRHSCCCAVAPTCPTCERFRVEANQR